MFFTEPRLFLIAALGEVTREMFEYLRLLMTGELAQLLSVIGFKKSTFLSVMVFFGFEGDGFNDLSIILTSSWIV